MNISIIVPNLNGEKLLKKNLPAIYEAIKDYKKGRVEIIIADDPSADRSLEVINSFFNGIRDKNISCRTVTNTDQKLAGFPKNITRGIEIATGDVLILLNSDVRPRQDFLEFILPHFEDRSIFAVACMDESVENGKKIYRGRGIGAWSRGFLHHERGEVDHFNTLWASCGSSAFSSRLWHKIGGIEIIYNPFYWEDIDLSYRALKSGYKIIFEKRSIVLHEHEKGAIQQTVPQSRIKRIAYRNQLIFTWINITDTDFLISHLLYLPFHLIRSILKFDWPFIYGFLEAVIKLKTILQKRKTYSTNFVKTDKAILKDFTK